MSRDTFMLDGRADSWKQLCRLRRTQLEERRRGEGAQPALFELRKDCRPKPARTAAGRRPPAGRYREPGLLDRFD